MSRRTVELAIAVVPERPGLHPTEYWLVVLADDGTLWERANSGDWQRLPPLPPDRDDLNASLGLDTPLPPTDTEPDDDALHLGPTGCAIFAILLLALAAIVTFPIDALPPVLPN